jgi:hypothetical protein
MMHHRAFRALFVSRLRVTALVASALLATGCATLGGKPPLVSDRPDFTESTPTIEPGHVQVEAGSTYSEEGPQASTSVGELFTRVGLVSRVELRLVGNSVVYNRFTGTPGRWGREDATLGAKFRLLDAPERPSLIPALSVIAGASLPTGTPELRSPHAQPEVKLLASWTINDRVSFASNANYARPSDGSGTVDEYSASASFGFTLTERVGAYTEAFGFFPRDGTSRKFVNVGSTLLLSPDLQLDARVGAGPSTKAGDFFVGIGVVRRW